MKGELANVRLMRYLISKTRQNVQGVLWTIRRPTYRRALQINKRPISIQVRPGFSISSAAIHRLSVPLIGLDLKHSEGGGGFVADGVKEPGNISSVVRLYWMMENVRGSPSLLYFVATVFQENVRIGNVVQKHERSLRFGADHE